MEHNTHQDDHVVLMDITNFPRPVLISALQGFSRIYSTFWCNLKIIFVEVPPSNLKNEFKRKPEDMEFFSS